MDTARNGAGRLVEHANRQSCCLQLDIGRSLDQKIRDFVWVYKSCMKRTAGFSEQRAVTEYRVRHNASVGSAKTKSKYVTVSAKLASDCSRYTPGNGFGLFSSS